MRFFLNVTGKRKKLCHSDFSFDGYDFVCKSLTEGRGVILYFKNCLYVQKVEILDNILFNESIWIRLHLKDNDSLLVGNIYRSPSSIPENNVLLNKLIVEAVNLKDTHILITGDFNYGTFNWESQQSSDSYMYDHCTSIFTECIKDTFLFQHVKESTRHRGDQTPSRLDLIFTNEEEMVTDLEYLPPLGAIDHSCLCFKHLCYSNRKLQAKPRHNYRKEDFSAMRSDLSDVN